MYRKMLCMLVAGMTAVSGYAQEEQPVEEILVKGYRGSLRDALELKRDSSSIVEAISAENIGQLPEVSISDSLSRLPGLAQDRDRGNGSQISIRGMGGLLGLTTLNGREVATVEEDRNIRYDQFPSELINGAQVYKTPQAKILEGGLSGTVNMETLKPLDHGQNVTTLGLRGSYYELASDIDDADAYGYRYSISHVNQFMDDTLGVSLGFAGRTQPIATKRAEPWNYGDTWHNSDGAYNAPWGGQAVVRGGEDERIGAMAALQWKPNENFELKYDLFYSKFEINEEQRGFDVTYGNTFTNITSTVPSNATNVADGTLDIIAGTTNIWNARNLNELFTQEDVLLSTGLNLEWRTGAWTMVGDLAYSSTDRDRLFLSMRTNNSVAQTGTATATFGRSGDIYQLTFNDGVDLLDPAQNEPAELYIKPLAKGDDEITSLAFDVSREFESGFFTSIDFGIRSSGRSKSLVAQEWTQFVTQNVGVPLSGTPGQIGFGGLPQFMRIDRQAAIDFYFGGMQVPERTDTDRLASWEVDEDVLAEYIQLNFATEIASVPVSGNFGVRAVQTDTESRGHQVRDQVGGDAVPVTISHSYDEVLPSLNLIFTLNDDNIVRFAWAKTIARAPLDFLSPALNVTTDQWAPNPNEAASGNAKLDPFRATQVDLAYEWYFQAESLLSVALFYKNVETYIARASDQTVEFDGTEYQVSLPINGSGGYIRGFELLYQQAITDNFGVYLNYAHTESNIRQFIPLNVRSADRFQLEGLSENVGTAALWYYRSGFEARLAYNFRSEFQRGVNRVMGEEGVNGDEGYYDLNFSYDLTDSFNLVFQIQNLTDEPYTVHGLETNNPAHINRYEEFGRRFLFGFNWKI